MIFIKKAFYSEIVFSDDFYIDGVNVLSDIHRIEIKKINYKLPVSLSYSFLMDSPFYQIKGLNSEFKIAISKVRDFQIVSFLTGRDFYRSHINSAVTQDSNNKNISLKFEIVKEILQKTESDSNTLYSENFKRKAIIDNKNGSYRVTYYSLVVEDECDFHFNESVSKYNFFGWEDEGIVSFFEARELAVNEVRLNLGDKKQLGDYHGYRNCGI